MRTIFRCGIVKTCKTHLNCPCGEAITGADEDDLVEKAQTHLSEAHPGREYDRDDDPLHGLLNDPRNDVPGRESRR